MKQLSILIPTLPQRLGDYFNIVNNIKTQIDTFGLQDNVQILSLLDSKEMSVGKKRNALIQMSCGKYVNFIDDDDRVSSDYVKKIYDATLSGADVVTFNGEYHESGIFHSNFIISTNILRDMNTNGIMYRKPNHLCPVKREIALQSIFPDKNYGEDSEYASQINKIIQSEHHIEEKLYFYMFNANTSQTIQHR
jgi:glycosyltransferase involved in cell wall biosynthesis